MSEQVYKLLSQIKTKIIKPRLFLMVMMHTNVVMMRQFLFVSIGYDFGEALVNAREFCVNKAPDTLPCDWQLRLWESLEIEDIVHQATTLTVEEVKEDVVISEKNKLMQQIIDKRDKKLFKANVKKFCETEIKLINNALKNKKK